MDAVIIILVLLVTFAVALVVPRKAMEMKGFKGAWLLMGVGIALFLVGNGLAYWLPPIMEEQGNSWACNFVLALGMAIPIIVSVFLVVAGISVALVGVRRPKTKRKKA